MNRNIQFDMINGVTEVLDFDESADFCGSFSDHNADREFLRGWFGEEFDGERAMEVGEKLFALIDAEYGIKKL